VPAAPEADPAPRAQLTGRAAFRGAGWGALSRLSGRIALDPSLIRGEPIEAAWIRGRHDPRRTSVKARMDAEAGRAALVAEAARGDEPAYEGRARLQLRQAERLVPAASGPANARITIRGSGRDPRTGPANMTALVRDLTLAGVKISIARARAALENGTVRVQELAVHGPQLDAKAAGTVRLETRAVDATAQGRMPFALLGRAGAPPLRGSASVQAEVHGSPGDVTARLRVEGKDIGGQTQSLTADVASYLPGELSFGLGTIQVLADGSHLGGAGATLAVVASGTDVRVGSVVRPAARLEVDWRQGPPVDRTRLTVTAGSGEVATDRLRATVRRRAAGAEVDVEELVLTPAPDFPIRLQRLARAIVAADHVQVVSLELGFPSDERRDAAPEPRVSVDGRFGLGEHGSSTGRLAIDALDLAPLCLAGRLGACQGRAGGRLQIAGTAAAPHITGRIATTNLVVEAVDCGVLETALDVRAATVRLTGALRPPAGEPLEFDARVPVDLSWTGAGRDTSRMPLSVVMHSDGLDLHLLAALVPGDVRDAGGRVLLDLRVDGTRAAPAFGGRAQLTGGWIKPTAAATVYSDVGATLIADDERLRLVGLRARSGDGVLEGDGAIDLDGGGRFGALALELRLTNFVAVRKQTLEAAVGGAVQLHGRPEAPVLTGALDITRLVLRPVAIEALSAAPLPQPDATIEIAGVPEQPTPEPGQDARAALDPLRVALDLRLTRDAWIRSPEAEIELGGELHVEKVPYERAQVTGKIVLLRGWYAFQGRRFNVRQGTITLPDGGGEAQLDVTGVYRVRGTGVAPGYDIFVTVRGPSSAPELTLASEPSLEKGDILSVLLFGKTMDELTAGQATGLQQQTMRLAGQYVIGELGGSVRDGLGLDTLEVSLPEGEQGTGSVTIGRHVTRDVLVSLGHEFGSTVAEVFGVEYGITPSISVRGSTTTDGRSAVDLFWRRRY
jgi:translocation and assembly module TamB